MDIETALTLKIGQSKNPIITTYEVGLHLFQLYQDKKYNGQEITSVRKALPERRDYQRHLNKLLERGILQESKSVSNHNVFAIFGKDQSSSEDIACSIDPFAYLSHLSAMEWHGLTDRLPKLMFLSTPPTKEWKEFAYKRMQRDLGAALPDYLERGLPPLLRYNFDRVNRNVVKRRSSIHLGAFINIRDRALRVSTIGRTFLDMIDSPDLCGGIYHVLDVYERHAEEYLDLIVSEIDRHGRKIDKVRAGYILDERLGLSHPVLESWSQAVQRGGSQKLDASRDYSPRYSEKWCLSLNVEA